jgi:hypothetical protein
MFAVSLRAQLPPAGALDGQDADVVARARDRPTSALESLPGDVADDVVSDLQDASVTGYRTAMVAGAVLAATRGAVSFLGVRDAASSATSTRSSSEA